MCVKKILNYLELGYARQWQIDQFTHGFISREEMLRKLEELDENLSDAQSKML